MGRFMLWLGVAILAVLAALFVARKIAHAAEPTATPVPAIPAQCKQVCDAAKTEVRLLGPCQTCIQKANGTLGQPHASVIPRSAAFDKEKIEDAYWRQHPADAPFIFKHRWTLESIHRGWREHPDKAPAFLRDAQK